MPLLHRLRGAILAGLLLILALVGGVHLVQADEPVPPRLFVQYGPDAEPVPMLPADFADVKVAAVNGPTDLEFLPDGRLLITRHYGVVSLWSGGTTTTEVLDIRDITCYAPERGLGGIAVDPNFTSNGYVYLYYSRKTDPSCPVSDDDIIPGLPINRVSRFTMDPTTNRLDRASETVIVDNIEAVWALHNGGGLEFGADGYLYVSVGDTGMIYNPDNPDSLRGKILRVDKSSGDGVPGNKYFDDPAAVRCGDGSNKQHEQGKPCREIFAIGLRNPFRIAFRPGTNEFFINDVGKQKYEEINLGAAGADYGWSRREGPCPYDTDCTPSGLVPPNDPIFWYHHDDDPNPIFHGCFAITGADFVPAGAWPAGYEGDYIFGDFTCGKIWRMEPKSGGGYQASLLAEGIGTSSIVAMTFGPSPVGQSLYYVVQNGNGQLHRIDYTGGGNRAPTAALSATPTYGPTPLTVSFDASGSSDPDPGDTLTYIWNFGDGTPTTETSSPTTSHTYSTAGVYNVTLQVRDNHGAVSALPASVRIDVGNTPPQPQIVAPAANAVYRVGQVFTLRGQARDPEDGQLSDSALSWRMLLHHNDHVHPFLGPVSGNVITFTAPTPEDLYAAATSYLEIELTATDSQGLSRVVTQNLQPHKIAVSFATEPAGLNLIVNGSIITTPQTLTSWEGYQLNLTAPNQQDASGRPMRFQSWSDGGAQSHSVTTPATPVTYKATFAPGNTAVLTPSADAYVREAAPGTNYGTLSTLRVDGGTDPDEAIYLRFNVTGATRPILAAKLRLYAQTDSWNGPAAYPTGNVWTESGIIWNNRPAATGAFVEDKRRIEPNSWVEYNVSSLVTGNGEYSFLVATDHYDGVTFSSRTGSQPPQLVLTFGSDELPTPTATASPTPSATATPTPMGPTVFRLKVQDSTSDAQEHVGSGAVSLNSPNLQLVNDPALPGEQIVGMRFYRVTVPPRARIVNAYLRFEADAPSSDVTSLVVHGQASDNAPAFSATSRNISMRPKTTASVAWQNVPAWTTVDSRHATPNIAAIVQEIVNRPGWVRGNGMVFLISGSGRRIAESFDGEPTAAPMLHIEYMLDGAAPTPTATATRTPTATATPTSSGPTVFRLKVQDSTGDAEEHVASGAVSLNSPNLQLVNDPALPGDQVVGMRFYRVTVPPRARIVNAYLRFETDAPSSDVTSLVVHGQASDNAAAFSATSHNISTRPKTAASAAWQNVPAWTTVDSRHATPNIAAIVQEIVNRPGWLRGNGMVFLISGSGRRVAESFDGEPTAAPMLHIEYALAESPAAVDTPSPTPAATSSPAAPMPTATTGVGIEKSHLFLPVIRNR